MAVNDEVDPISPITRAQVPTSQLLREALFQVLQAPVTPGVFDFDGHANIRRARPQADIWFLFIRYVGLALERVCLSLTISQLARHPALHFVLAFQALEKCAESEVTMAQIVREVRKSRYSHGLQLFGGMWRRLGSVF